MGIYTDVYSDVIRKATVLFAQTFSAKLPVRMALTAAGTREAQDDLVKSFYESLASTRALAEESIAEYQNLATDLDFAAVWFLANRLERKIGEYPRIYDEMVTLARAKVLMSEGMRDRFVKEWRQVRDQNLDRREKVIKAALQELKKSNERYTAELAKAHKCAGLDNVCTD